MKTFYKIFIILFSIVFLGIACNNDEQNDINKKESNSSESLSSLSNKNAKISCNLTLNNQNPYNYVGQIHNEIISSYLTKYDDNTKDVDLIIERIDEIGNDTPNFVANKDQNYTPISSQVIISGLKILKINLLT